MKFFSVQAFIKPLQDLYINVVGAINPTFIFVGLAVALFLFLMFIYKNFFA